SRGDADRHPGQAAPRHREPERAQARWQEGDRRRHSHSRGDEHGSAEGARRGRAARGSLLSSRCRGALSTRTARARERYPAARERVPAALLAPERKAAHWLRRGCVGMDPRIPLAWQRSRAQECGRARGDHGTWNDRDRPGHHASASPARRRGCLSPSGGVWRRSGDGKGNTQEDSGEQDRRQTEIQNDPDREEVVMRDFEREPFVVIERDEPGVGTLLLGVMIGAGLALLLAPRSGADTRRMIESRARRAGARVRNVATDVADNVTSQVNDVRDRVTQRVGAARRAVRRGQDQVLDAVDAGRYAASEARSDLERRIAENKAARREANSL